MAKRESMDRRSAEGMAGGRESKRQLVLSKLEAKAQATPHAPEAEAFRAKADALKIHTECVQVAPVVEGAARALSLSAIGTWMRVRWSSVTATVSRDGIAIFRPELYCCRTKPRDRWRAS